MRMLKASRSAEGVAAIRAIEALRPVAERVVDDPLAHQMVRAGPTTLRLTRYVLDSPLYERLAPGAVAFIVSRERYIDEFVGECLAEGFEQIVFLGAGFDTRPYRIPGIEQARVLEVDQHATQAVKIDRLRRALGSLPAHVRFVPVDFNEDSLDERLRASGYDERLLTLFVWQGVTYFLTATGVDRTLAFAATSARVGSAVVFDYLYSEALAGGPVGSALRRASKMSGEPYVFGIPRGTVADFLATRGFVDVRDVAVERLVATYCTTRTVRIGLQAGFAIASCRVAAPRT